MKPVKRLTLEAERKAEGSKKVWYRSKSGQYAVITYIQAAGPAF